MHFQKVSDKNLVRSTLRWPYFYFSPVSQDHIGDGCFEKQEKTESRGLLITDAWSSVKQKGGRFEYVCISMHEGSRRGERDGQLSLYQLLFFPTDPLDCFFFHKESDPVWEKTYIYIFIFIFKSPTVTAKSNYYSQMIYCFFELC